MALPVITPDKIIPMEQVLMLIYGRTGVGKTTLAGTAKNAIVFDCERGSYRSIRSANVLDIPNIETATKYADDPDLAAYDTVIVDSFYGLIQLSIDYLHRTNPTMMQRDGTPHLKGWGTVTQSVVRLLEKFINSGKDVVCISHLSTSKKKGSDEDFYSPEIQGGARKFVEKMFSFIGYLSNEKEGLVLSFLADSHKEYKNSHEALGSYIVPNVNQNPNFLAEIIHTAKQNVSAGTEKQQKAAAGQVEWRGKIEASKVLADFESLRESLMSEDGLPEYTVQVLKTALLKKAKTLGFEVKDGKFVAGSKGKEGDAV